MIQKTETREQLKRLYEFLEHIKQQRLGLDWQSKISYNEIEKQVVEKIKILETRVSTQSMVK